MSARSRSGRSWLALALAPTLLAAAAGFCARAEAAPGKAVAPAPEPEPVAVGEPQRERPWAKGVSPEQQLSALSHFREGNALLKESLFRQAVDKYQEALREWDHPGIHYNLALALLSLDQPLEVHEHLERALKFGPAPLDADKFEHAKSYLTLIEKQLAPVEVKCEVPGASVSMDGKPLFQAPGEYKALIRPGPHTVTAAKSGFPTTERTRVLLPGQPSQFNLRVYAEGELIGYRRNWPTWKPVTVTVAGGALLVAGLVMTLEARSQFNTFDDRLKAQCATGCRPTSDVASYKDTGELLQTMSWISYSLGAMAVAGGAYLLYLNREIPYRIEPADERQNGPTLTVTPFATSQSAGVAGTARF
jgi:tetratricopeptide (TPR) repeat protein